MREYSQLRLYYSPLHSIHRGTAAQLDSIIYTKVLAYLMIIDASGRVSLYYVYHYVTYGGSFLLIYRESVHAWFGLCYLGKVPGRAF